MAKKSRRNNLRRKGQSLFIGLLTFFSIHAKAKDGKHNEQTDRNSFSWTDQRKLSWNDFKGAVNAQTDESAAATCCSIGLKVDNNDAGKPEVKVYNAFYINKSWVKEDAKIESILAHEQGHFDLCELYTRKLRDRVESIDLHSHNVKDKLMNAYSAVSDEYEARQQAYEQETEHGVILTEQQRWQDMIANELGMFQ